MAKKKTKAKIPPLLTIREVANILRVRPVTLRRWDEKSILKAVRIGSRSHPKKRSAIGDRRYRLEDIQRFISEGLNK